MWGGGGGGAVKGRRKMFETPMKAGGRLREGGRCLKLR